MSGEHWCRGTMWPGLCHNKRNRIILTVATRQQNERFYEYNLSALSKVKEFFRRNSSICYRLQCRRPHYSAISPHLSSTL